MDYGRVVLTLHFSVVFHFAFAARKAIDHIRSHISASGAHGGHKASFDELNVDGVAAITPVFLNHTRKTFRAIFRAKVIEHIKTPKPAEIAAFTRTAPRSPFLANAGVPSAALVDWRSYLLRRSIRRAHPGGSTATCKKLKRNPNKSGAEFKNLGPYFAAFEFPVGFAAHVWLSGAPGFSNAVANFDAANSPFLAFA